MQKEPRQPHIDCEQQLDHVIQQCQQIKQVLDNSPRDCYDYVQATDLINKLQAQAQQLRPECVQYTKSSLFTQQLLALHTCTTEWHAELLQKLKQPNSQFNIFSLRMIRAAIFQMHITTCCARFLLAVGPPERNLTAENVNFILQVFYCNMFQDDSQQTLSFGAFYQKFKEFFAVPLEKYADFDTFFVTSDEESFQMQFGDMWLFHDLISKLLEGYNCKQLSEKNLLRFKGVTDRYSPLQLRRGLEGKRDVAQVLDLLNAAKKPEKPGAGKVPRVAVGGPDEAAQKQAALFLSTLEGIRHTQRQLPVAITAHELLALPKAQAQTFLEQAQWVGQAAAQRFDDADVTYQIVRHFASPTQPRALKVGADAARDLGRALQPSHRDVLQNCLKAANAAPYVINRLVSREAVKVLRQNLASAGRQVKGQIARQVLPFVNHFVDRLYGDLVKYNQAFSAQCKSEKEVKELFVRASEIEDESIFMYKDDSDTTAFISESIGAFIQLSLNYTFMMYDQADVSVSVLTGQVSPIRGSFSTKMTIYYFLAMQQYWNDYEAVGSAFQQAQKVINDICCIKAGVSSDIVQKATKQRYYSHKPGVNRYFLASLVHLLKHSKEINKQMEKCRDIANCIVMGMQSTRCQEYIYNYVKQVQLLYQQDLYTIVNQTVGVLEALQFKDQNHSIFNQQIMLTPEFRKIAGECGVKECQSFSVAVIGYHGSGKTKLVNQLTYQPTIRFATIVETLQQQNISFNALQVIKQPGKNNMPWRLLTDTELEKVRVIKKTKPISADSDQNHEIISAGSWLNMDSTNLTQSNQSKKTEDENFNEEQCVADFIKNFRIAQQDEQSKAPIKSCGAKVDTPDFVRPSSSLEPQELKFVDYLVSCTDNLQSDQKQLGKIEEKKIVLPEISFVQLQPLRGTSITKSTISLITTMAMEFYDIPTFAFFTLQRGREEVQRQQQVRQKIRQLQQQAVELNKQQQEQKAQLIKEINTLFDAFRKAEPQLRQQQQNMMQNLVDPKTKQLNTTILPKLLQLIVQQLATAKQEAQNAATQKQQLAEQFQKLETQLYDNQAKLQEMRGQVDQALKQCSRKQQAYGQMAAQLAAEQESLRKISQLHQNQRQNAIVTKQVAREIEILGEQEEVVNDAVIQKTQEYVSNLKIDMYLFVYSATDERSIDTSELKALLTKLIIQQAKKVIILCNKVDMDDYINHGNIEAVLQLVLDINLELNKANKPILYCEHYFGSAATGVQVNDVVRLRIADWALHSRYAILREKIVTPVYKI